jgi:hypothetical protein
MEIITNEVLAERLENFESHNNESFDFIKSELKEIKEKYGERIRSLEDWRLAFVTKFTTYSAIALFAGMFISNLVFDFLKGKF